MKRRRRWRTRRSRRCRSESVACWPRLLASFSTTTTCRPCRVTLTFCAGERTSVCIMLRGNTSDATSVRTYLHEIFIGTLNTRGRFLLCPSLVHKTSLLKLMHRTRERLSCFRGVGALERRARDISRRRHRLSPARLGGLMVFNDGRVRVCTCVR